MECIAWPKIRGELALSLEVAVTEVSDYSGLIHAWKFAAKRPHGKPQKKSSFIHSTFEDPFSNYLMPIKAWLAVSVGLPLRRTPIGVSSHAVPWT
jgi:hypothetical protein